VRSEEWNAKDYARHSRAQQTWAQQAIARLGLSPNDSLLDVGCGDGKITAEIAEILSQGEVVGIDKSKAMIDLAIERYPRTKHRNLEFVVADAAAIPFESRFDVVFSNSVLHWVKDHPAMLRGVARSLKPGGRIYLAFGARGTAAGIRGVFDQIRERDAWRNWFSGFAFPLTLHGPEQYQEWLPAFGFEPSRLDVSSRDMTHAGREGLAGWVRTTWFPYINRVPEGRRQAFLDEVLDEYLTQFPIDAAGRAHVAMVSLEVEARKI